MLKEDSFDKTSTHPLQSWAWGEFREATGNEVVRFPFGQITVHPIPFSNLKVGAFIKGPKPTKKMLQELSSYAKKNNLIFIKLEPNIVPKDVKELKKLILLLKDCAAVPGKTLFTPSSFWIDLQKSEDELLKSFSSKTRYNIRLADRKGVKVKEDNSKKAFEKYLQLTRETVERQGFYAHSEKYHRLMWKYLNTQLKDNPIARILSATYKGEIITTWVIFVWKDFLYYPYGASSDKHKNVMANNLVMWEAIKYGKRLGLKTFDLWGREPGKGFTKFKEGYNPKVVEFLGSWDLVTSPLYKPYRFADYLRWAALRTKSKFSKPTF
jgi:lipid II:glycine glycyltransferase (peptidoglycan interpeptide bridge formation enzyme)